MKKFFPYLMGLAMVIAALAWFVVHESNKTTFQERAIAIGTETLGPDAVITFNKGVEVQHWEELKKPYLDALELYYEASLFGVVDKFNYPEAYEELKRATPNGPEKYFYQDLTWITIEHMRTKGMAINDTVYLRFLDARKEILAADVAKHEKTGRCLMLEAETLAAKINRGEFNEVLYVKYEVNIEMPVTDNVSFLKTIWLKEYDYTKELKDKEFFYLKDQFLARIIEYEVFKNKIDC